MTGVEVYAFFISPFVIGAACLFMIWLTGWQDRREDSRREVAHASSGSSPRSSMPNPDKPT